MISLSVLLGIAVLGIAVIGAFLLRTSIALDEATELLEQQHQRIEQQDRLLEEQSERLEQKETFGAAMQGLMATVQQFDGLALGGLIDVPRIQAIATGAWEARNSPEVVRQYTTAAEELQVELAELLDAAAARLQAGSGSTAEQVILALGRGFVTTVWGDASEVCQREALGCVSSGDPYVIHLDAAGFAQPYRTSWGATLVAHHEFAHVLQFTHPEATDVALPAFGDDPEVMADCYALTATDSWTLDERVWQGSSAYWDVSYGYGTVCDGAQRSAISAWLAETGVRYQPITQ